MLALSTKTKHEGDAGKKRICVMCQWEWVGWIFSLWEKNWQERENEIDVFTFANQILKKRNKNEPIVLTNILTRIQKI